MSICASCRPGLGLRPVRPCAAGAADRPGRRPACGTGSPRRCRHAERCGSSVLPVSICASCRPGLGLRPVRLCAAGAADRPGRRPACGTGSPRRCRHAERCGSSVLPVAICASCRPGLGLRPVRPCAAGAADRPGRRPACGTGSPRRCRHAERCGSSVLPVSICASCRPGLGLRPVRPCAAGAAGFLIRPALRCRCFFSRSVSGLLGPGAEGRD